MSHALTLDQSRASVMTARKGNVQSQMSKLNWILLVDMKDTEFK
jgi:hypothetical protein